MSIHSPSLPCNNLLSANAGHAARPVLAGLTVAVPLAGILIVLQLTLVPRRPAVGAAPERGPVARAIPAAATAAAEQATEPDVIPVSFSYSAIAVVFAANGGRIPASGAELTAALARTGGAAQLPVSFSAVAHDSGLANPRVVFVPDSLARRRTVWWSAETAEGPARTSTISAVAANTPELTGRLFLAVNLERTDNGTPRARSIEFISWNSLRKRFDFGLIENLNADGGPRLRVVEEVKCVSCHKTRGPILGGAPWSNTIHNSLLLNASLDTLNASGRLHTLHRLSVRDPFDGINLLNAHAAAVDENVRLGAERLHNREAFRLLTHSPEGRRVLALLLGRLVTPTRPVQLRAGRIPAFRSRLAAPLAQMDLDLPVTIDVPLTRAGFAAELLAFQEAAPSSILVDFSPAGPSRGGPGGEWGGTTFLVLKYDRSRAEGSVALPSQHRPSNPRAFLRRTVEKAPPSSTVNVSRLAEAIGVTEGDRDFLVRTLLEVAYQLDDGKATAADLAAAVLEGPSFADVLKHGALPDRDEFKDRFMAGLKEVLRRQHNRADAIAFDRTRYASTPAFTPRLEGPESPPTPSTACLRCHDVWSAAKASLTDPVPTLAFDPFDRKAREDWVRMAPPGRRVKVLTRMLERLLRDQDMPPEDSPEHERYRKNDAAGFEVVLTFLRAELDRAVEK